jgi:RHS repeat-associated protein
MFAGGYGQTTPAFVQQERITVTGVKTDSSTYTLSLTQKQTVRTYFDGLSRPLQKIGVQASPLQNDIVQPVVYDALGRQTTGYLPYGGSSTDVIGGYRSNAISTAQPAFYNNSAQSVVPVDADPYSQKVYENSPLQRVLESGMVGYGFQPVSGQHYKAVSYRSNNTSADGNVLQWNNNGTYTSGTYYAANSLTVIDATDEDGLETRTFTDNNGHIMLKRQIFSGGNLDTYYIYNNAGMISYIVPPKAMAIMAGAGTYSLTYTGVPALIFSYSYDAMGRTTSKTVPGGVTMSIIYDPYNRPVLMQDANMAVNYEWNYTKYDVKGRVIEQGILTDPNHFSASQMQTHVNGVTYTTWYESRTSTLTLSGYYTDNVFPTISFGTLQPLAFQYYDSYTLPSGTTYSYHPTGLTGEVGATMAQVKGAATILQQSTVSNSVTAVWLTSVQFYDQNLHPIQVQSNNLIYSSATPTDYKTTVPDFTGMPLITLVSKETGTSTTTSVQSNITYDQMYRITALSQSYNGGTAVQVAAYTYNEVGQMVKKGLGGLTSGTFPATPNLSTTYSGTNTEIATQSITMNPGSGGVTGFNVPSGSNFTGYISTGYLQVVDYRYNIRGQLLSMNNSKLADDYGKTDDDPSPVFGMTFLYDGTDPTLNNGAGNSPKYDGRVSAVKWMSRDGVGYERSYVYSYDGVNRYTGETYSERAAGSTGSFSNNVHGFDETITGYDAGGNITGLQRNSSTEGTNSNIQIDNLTYTYNSSNADQLSIVTDGTGANYTGYGFRNLTGSTTAYAYDNNGNLVNDYYKGITIGYNVGNRTDKVTVTTGSGQYINYVYDASGKLLRKLAYSSGTLQTQTDYLDGFIYVNGTLSFLTTPEGRVIYNSGTFTPEYVITDGDGNARVSFQNNGSGVAVVKQENSYYGFGLLLANSPVGMSTPPNRFMYKGSEWQNDYSNLPDYYQMYYRNYDQAIGRFVSVDPEPESAASMTSYQYGADNPVMNHDPMGNKSTGKPTHAYNQQLFLTDSWNGISGGCSGPDEDGVADAIAESQVNVAMEEAQEVISQFWSTALSVSTQIMNAEDDDGVTGVHFTGQEIEGIVNTVQNMADDQSLTLQSYSNGSMSMTLTTDLSYSYTGLSEGEAATIGIGMGGGSSLAST